MGLRLVPIELKVARRFVGEHHRHNIPPRGWRFGVGVENGVGLVGVGVFSRPVGRELQDGFTGEIIRSCTDGTRNANSMLYGALIRAAKALGYQRIYTYTLPEESGASLKAVGFTVDAEIPARAAWDYTGQSRDQVDLFGNDRRPPGRKIRWVIQLSEQGTM